MYFHYLDNFLLLRFFCDGRSGPFGWGRRFLGASQVFSSVGGALDLGKVDACRLFQALFQSGQGDGRTGGETVEDVILRFLDILLVQGAPARTQKRF